MRLCSWASLHISHNWQSNGILRCRKSKQTFLFSLQTELKRFPGTSVQHGNELLFNNTHTHNKKISFTEKKGAFSCDLRHLQNGRVAVRLTMARIDMENQAERKHELKRMQKPHGRQKEEKKKESKDIFSPICVPDFVHHNSVYRGAHLRVGRTLINIHFIPRRRKRHLGPVKMIKSITPYKQCEVWGGYNSIRWSWEDTLIKRKKLYVRLRACIVYL